MSKSINPRHLDFKGTPAPRKEETQNYFPIEAAKLLAVPVEVIRAFLKSGRLKKAFPASNSDLIDGDGVRAMLRHGVLQTNFMGKLED